VKAVSSNGTANTCTPIVNAGIYSRQVLCGAKRKLKVWLRL